MKESWAGAVNAGQMPTNMKDNDIHQNTNPLTAQDEQQSIVEKPFTGFDKSGAPNVINPLPVLTPPQPVKINPIPQPIIINSIQKPVEKHFVGFDKTSIVNTPLTVKPSQNLLLNDKELFHKDERELISPNKSDVAKLLSFKDGGIVSGKSGQKKIVEVHAQEVILPEKTAKELRKLLNKNVTITKKIVRKKKKNKGKFKFVKENGGIRRYFNGKASV